MFLLIFLIACSTANQQKVDATGNAQGWIKFKSSQDMTFNFQGKDYQVKAGVLEELTSIPKQSYYNVTTWNENSYKTRNICYLNSTCNLFADQVGIAGIVELNRTAFNISMKGDVRKPIVCIGYSGIWWYGIDAVETDIPAKLKTKVDHCYIAEPRTYNYRFKNESGDYSINAGVMTTVE